MILLVLLRARATLRLLIWQKKTPVLCNTGTCFWLLCLDPKAIILVVC